MSSLSLKRRLVPAILLAVLLAPALPAHAASAQEVALARAQELLDAGQPEAALEALEGAGRKVAKSPESLLLRSTARLMLGDSEAGLADLDKALELDPSLRQGWLNRAAIDIAGARYAQALVALEKARELDPQAPDNDLNIGAVKILAGDLGGASEHFSRYVGLRGGASDAHYLVATNYAVAGYAALAVEHLRESIAADEHSRLEARSDPSFLQLADNPQFKELLAGPPAAPGAGSHQARRTFEVPYESGQGVLMKAVLDTLQLTGQRFDPRVEVTQRWALIWGEMRIVLSAVLGGKSSVELSAPLESHTPSAWRETSERLLDEIYVRVTAAATRDASS